MLAKVLKSKAFWALVLPVVLTGSVFAGGADCHSKKADVAKAGKNAAHCNLMAKQIAKTVKEIDHGVVVALKGTSETAVAHIKEHLTAHADSATDCPNCPLSMSNVVTKVKMTDDGGEITATTDNDEALKALTDWANKPAGACCKGEKGSEA